MDRHHLIQIARQAGFKIEAGKYPGNLIIEGGGGISEQTLAKFMELISEVCSEIALDGGYGCRCARNIRKQMTFALEPAEYSEDIVDFLMLRVLKMHGGPGDEMRDHFNLTKTDSIMHLAAAEEITRLRRMIADAPTTKLQGD